MIERLTVGREAEIRARYTWVLAYLHARKAPRLVTELRALVADAGLLLHELDALRRERDEALDSARRNRDAADRYAEEATNAEAAARFGARVLAAHREHLGDDVDGADLQDWAVEAGLLERLPVTESCGDECVCEPGDTCYFLTQAGTGALKRVTS